MNIFGSAGHMLTMSVIVLSSARVAQKWPQATRRRASMTVFQGNLIYKIG